MQSAKLNIHMSPRRSMKLWLILSEKKLMQKKWEIYGHITVNGYVEGMTEDLIKETGISLEDMVIRQIEIEILQKAMQSLTEVQKERLHLYFFKGMTTREIADKLGVSQNVVWKSIRGSINTLKKFFWVEGCQTPILCEYLMRGALSDGWSLPKIFSWYAHWQMPEKSFYTCFESNTELHRALPAIPSNPDTLAISWAVNGARRYSCICMPNVKKIASKELSETTEDTAGLW